MVSQGTLVSASKSLKPTESASRGRWRSVSYMFAVVHFVLAAITWLTLPVLYFDDRGDWLGFLYAGTITALVALVFYLFSIGKKHRLLPRQMFFATTFSWILISIFASLPLIFGSTHLSFTDAVFESISGITTTGSSVITDIDGLHSGIKLWRGLLQWVGGIGIIVMAIAALPQLKIGGMRLFQTESSDTSDKWMPQIKHLATGIMKVYLLLSIACFICYFAGGMSVFDAVVHTMTTVSTGGFANYGASFGVYNDKPWLLWFASLFMLLSAMPFVLFIKAMSGNTRSLFSSPQVKHLIQLVLAVSIVLALYQWFYSGRDLLDGFTHSLFNVISVISTAGYASEDYSLWGTMAVMVFFYITFVGGCSGSTAGGMKIFRFDIALAVMRRQLNEMVHPNGVFVARYSGREITDDIVRSVVVFGFFFFVVIALLALGLAGLGLDPVTALTGAATAVANVGPGLGDQIGPAGSFAGLPDAAKWLLCVGMLLGRLEIITVLVILTPAFWRG